MPKLKTKSGAKKRFTLTASGLVKAKHANKRHCMFKRSQKQVRNLRKGTYLQEGDSRIVKRYYFAGII